MILPFRPKTNFLCFSSFIFLILIRFQVLSNIVTQVIRTLIDHAFLIFNAESLGSLEVFFIVVFDVVVDVFQRSA